MKRTVEARDIKSKPYLPLMLFVVLFVIAFIVFSILSFISNNTNKDIMKAPGECALVLENSLLTYWPFDENPQTDQGSIEDYVAQKYIFPSNSNSINLTYSANDGAVVVNKAITGIRGSAMEFNGHDYAIAYALLDDNLKESNAFSMSVWINLKNTNVYYYIVRFGLDTTDSIDGGVNAPFSGYYFFVDRNLACFGNSIKTSKSILCGNISSNNWVHLVGAQNEDGMALYVNGRTVLKTSGGFRMNTTNRDEIVVGGYVLNNYSEFKIGIDEMAFFQKALNSTEVSNIYNAGRGIDLCSERINPVGGGSSSSSSSGGGNINKEIIIDNTDSGFSSSGYWPFSNKSLFVGQYGDDSIWSRAYGANANWTFNIPEENNYELSGWWTAGNSRIPKVPYYIYRNKALIENFTIDQTNMALNSKWNVLGRYSLSKGDNLTISLIVLNTSKSHNADAMKLNYSNASSIVPPVNCTDNDEDSYGVGCSLGGDCDDDNENIHQNLPCIHNGTTCGNYQICAASCPQIPVEICGNIADENCDGINETCTAVPVLTVSYPENITYVNVGVPLRFSAPGASNCWYVLNDNRTNSGCVEDKKLYLNTGDYVINIAANNSFGVNQTTRIFSVVKNRTYFITYDEFYNKGQTTNLLTINESDLDKIPSFVLDNSFGKIEFLELVNLSKDANSDKIIDIDSGVNISFNRIEIDSSVLPSLNRKARVTIIGINFTRPLILKNNVNCTDCIIERNENNSVVFSATGFSIYRVIDASSPIVVKNKTDNRTDAQKSCFELKGSLCNSNQDCSVTLKDSLNGKCCVGSCNTRDNRRKVSLSDEPSSASLVDGEKILLQSFEGDYELITTIDGEKVSVSVDDEDYILKLNRISEISIGSDKMYVALKSVSDGEAEIIVGTDKKAVQEELGTGGTSNSVMIIIVVVFILAIIGIGVTILFLIQKKEKHPGKISREDEISGDSGNSVFKIRRNQ